MCLHVYCGFWSEWAIGLLQFNPTYKFSHGLMAHVKC